MAAGFLLELGQLLEGDLIVNFGPPLVTFLQNVANAQGDKIKFMAALVQLQGDMLGHAPTALGGLEAQLATIIATRISVVAAGVPPLQDTIGKLEGLPPTPPATAVPPAAPATPTS